MRFINYHNGECDRGWLSKLLNDVFGRNNNQKQNIFLALAHFLLIGSSAPNATLTKALGQDELDDFVMPILPQRPSRPSTAMYGMERFFLSTTHRRRTDKTESLFMTSAPRQCPRPLPKSIWIGPGATERRTILMRLPRYTWHWKLRESLRQQVNSYCGLFTAEHPTFRPQDLLRNQ